MAAISTLLRRLGYARLDDYGLIETPEGRILSTRPAVLDDGLGGKIVGWREGDLAAMELEHWEPAGRRATAPKPIPPPRMAAQMPAQVPELAELAPPPVAARNLPGVTPSLAPPAVSPPTVVATPVVARPPVVAAEPVADEDEWEWEIAMARARAAAEWAEEAAQHAVKPASPVVKPVPRARRATTPIAIVAAPRGLDDWPKTEELQRWETPTPAPNQLARISDRTRMSRAPSPAEAIGRATEAIERARAVAFAQSRAQQPRATVIPVPTLPSVSDPRLVRPSAPILPRTAPPSRHAAPPSRFPRATDRVDDTVRTQPVAPANDDHTSPGIAMPPASSGKRAASKQR